MDREPTVVLEGLLEDLTPIAFGAARALDDATKEFNASPGNDLQGAFDLLKKHQLSLVHAIAQLEIRVRTLAGEVETRD